MSALDAGRDGETFEREETGMAQRDDSIGGDRLDKSFHASDQLTATAKETVDSQLLEAAALFVNQLIELAQEEAQHRELTQKVIKSHSYEHAWHSNSD